MGPIWGSEGGRERELLASCYRRCLEEAARLGCHTIAFPAISTGAFGFPKEEAARVAGAELRKHRHVQEVRLVFFSEFDARIFREHSGLT